MFAKLVCVALAAASVSAFNPSSRRVHVGVRCDGSGVEPIVGTRYHLPGRDIDLCEAEFLKLGPEARREFVTLPPGYGRGPSSRSGYGNGPGATRVGDARVDNHAAARANTVAAGVVHSGVSPIVGAPVGGARLHPVSTAAPSSRRVHVGIKCDGSGVEPIVGTRYHLPGRGIDLCESEFLKLGPEARREFITLPPRNVNEYDRMGYGAGAQRVAVQPGVGGGQPYEPQWRRASGEYDYAASPAAVRVAVQPGVGGGEPYEPQWRRSSGDYDYAASPAAVRRRAAQTPNGDVFSSAKSAAPAYFGEAQKSGYGTTGYGTGYNVGSRYDSRYGSRYASGGSASAGRGVHVGVRCDASGVQPIVGTRYHMPRRGIDLCETEYMKLGPDQKREFITVPPPGHGYDSVGRAAGDVVVRGAGRPASLSSMGQYGYSSGDYLSSVATTPVPVGRRRSEGYGDGYQRELQRSGGYGARYGSRYGSGYSGYGVGARGYGVGARGYGGGGDARGYDYVTGRETGSEADFSRAAGVAY